MTLLVTGGAGYIGSVTTELLRGQGENVVVLDNLSRGHRDAVPPSVPFYHGDIADTSLVTRIAVEHEVEACVHFAAFAYVGESVSDPARYFRNNVAGTIGLLDGLLQARVKRFVFSSTCATYGEPIRVPIDEDHPQNPTNPYGRSKLMIEQILEAYEGAYALKYAALRYFNAAGAIPSRGEHHDPETHIIPLVLQVARGLRPHVSIFGADYPTPDGTAIRDYIHVADLAEAHRLALQHLRAGGDSIRLNLGTGAGYSVMELVEMARQVTGRGIEVRMEPRRPGDPSRLIANAARAHAVLGWTPGHPDLLTILRTAWEWDTAHPEGYLE